MSTGLQISLIKSLSASPRTFRFLCHHGVGFFRSVCPGQSGDKLGCCFVYSVLAAVSSSWTFLRSRVKQLIKDWWDKAVPEAAIMEALEEVAVGARPR